MGTPNSYTKQLEEQVEALEKQIAAHNAEHKTVVAERNEYDKIIMNCVYRIISLAHRLLKQIVNIRNTNSYDDLESLSFRGRINKIHDLMLLLDTNIYPASYTGWEKRNADIISFIEGTVEKIKNSSDDRSIFTYAEVVFYSTILEDILSNNVSVSSARDLEY